MIVDVLEIALLARGHKSFGNAFQILPPAPDLLRFVAGNLIVMGRIGDDVKEIGKFLHNLVGRRDQIMRLRNVLRILNKKSAGALADPLRDPLVTGALQQRFNAVERIGNAAPAGPAGRFRMMTGAVSRRFSPFVNYGYRQADILGDLFGRFCFEDLAQKLMGLHASDDEKIASNWQARTMADYENPRQAGC